MKQILKLVFLLVIGQTAFAQAPSNYTNINGRYRWIAGMFDSTFHIPKGTTPSLRTGGSTNAGALFYRTSDSTVRYWTGSQWLTLSDTTRFVPYVGAIKDVDLNSWSLNAKSLHIKGTAGQGHLGLKFQSATPSMSANESGVYADANGNFGVKIDNAYTSIFKTNLNSADRTYTFQNKSYTVGDSSDIAARVKYTDTASMLSPYLRSNVASATYVPYTGATTSLDMGLFNIYGQNIVSNNYATGAAMSSISRSDVTANAYGTLLLKRGVWGTLQPNPLTAFDKNWYLPDTSGTLALASQLSGYVPTTRTITINGTSQDLSANRTYNVGTVTSVATSTGTGITGGTITSSGTIAADTLLLSTRAWRQKGIDSVAALANTKISGTGTTNYIPKFTSSSAIGNSVIYDNGGNIGIGTTGAVGNLQINGASEVSEFLSVGGTRYMGFYTDGTLSAINSYNSSPLVFSLSSGTGFSEQMRLTSTGLGIGTSNPGNKLSVTGAANIRDYLLIDNSQSYFGDNGVIGGGAADGNTLIQYYTTKNLIFKQSGTERMRLDASGNLGLGVTPSAWRNIFNAFQVGYTGTLYSTTTGTAAEQVNLASNYYQNSAGSELRIQAGYATRYQQASGQHIWSTAGTSTAGSAISFTQAMTLDASGNLGLGTTSPTGYSSSNIVLHINTSSANADLKLTNGTTGTSATAGGLLRQTAANTYLWNGSNGVMGFGTNNTERMTISATGNVGIGTTSPSGLLDLSSTTNIYENIYTSGNNASAVISMYNSTGVTDGAAIGYNVALRFGTITGVNAAGFSEKMKITSAGNVGIGTTSPTTKLHTYLADGANDNRLLIQQGSNGYAAAINLNGSNDAGSAYNYINSGTTGGTAMWQIGGGGVSNTMIMYTAGNERMRITSGGNVLIGTTTAGDYGLRVDVGTNNHSATFLNNTSGYATVQIVNTTAGATKDFITFRTAVGSASLGDITGTSTQLQLNGSTNLVLATGGSERARFTSSGELLINTTSDAGDYKLQVNGGSYFTGNLRAFGAGFESYDATYNLSMYQNVSGGVSGLYSSSNNDFGIWTNASRKLTITSGGNVGIGITGPSEKLEVNGAIKTASPSGGTAKPWKLGEAGVSVGGANTTAVKVEIDGVVYYLLTAYLPEPTPEPAPKPKPEG